MGVPRFFAELIKKYPIHFWKDNVGVDYFFIDFNGTIYTAFANVKKEVKDYTKLSIAVLERKIINEIVKLTRRLVCEVAKPKKLLYISIDGPAPRAKMVQQRSRRYKSAIMNREIDNMLRAKYNMEKIDEIWDPSSNAAPGTKFMKKLSDTIRNKIDKNYFNPGHPIEVIMSDSNVPGEGEHKFLNYIREMDRDSDQSVCLYGNDGDLIVLAMGLQKKNTYLLREVKDSEVEIQQYADKEFLYLSIDTCRSEVFKDMTRYYKKTDNPKINELSVTNDFVFLSFMFGNDFVEAMQFMKIAGGGLDLLIGYYRTILGEMDDTLVYYDMDSAEKPMLNTDFLRNIFCYISKSEDKYMKRLQKKINDRQEGKLSKHQWAKEDDLTEYEIDVSRYQHLELCSTHNPLYDEYSKDFMQIDYNLQKYEWKQQYYKYFFGISKKNVKEYNMTRTEVVKNYLESLMFTLNYYFVEPPSWSWFYEYRVPPIPSDVFQVLQFDSYKDINKLSFEKSEPYTPFQQLMLILSPLQRKMVPKSLGNLMIDEGKGLAKFYPRHFRLDAVAGMKYIYSEAMLPEIDENMLLGEVKKLEEKLGSNDSERNQVSMEPYIKTL